MGSVKKTEKSMRCLRCGGRMISERFDEANAMLPGWHCIICGEILDPVILLHRLSQNANLKIPSEKEEIINLLQKYLQDNPEKLAAVKG